MRAVRAVADSYFSMGYQRAFSTLGCPDLTLDEVNALAGCHGISAIELRALGGRLDLPLYLAQEFKNPPTLASRMEASSVKIVALDTSFRLIGNEPSDRNALLEYVPWAEALGVDYLRIFDGGHDASKQDIHVATDTLNWWREIRSTNDWKTDVMVETHDAFVTTAAIRNLVAAIPDLKILWDAHHTWKKGGEDPLKTWAALKNDIVHIHVKDSVSRPSAKHPFTYVSPGEGEFPAAALHARLKEEFSGVVSLEWEKLWHPYLAPLDVALSSATARGWW